VEERLEQAQPAGPRIFVATSQTLAQRVQLFEQLLLALVRVVPLALRLALMQLAPELGELALQTVQRFTQVASAAAAVLVPFAAASVPRRLARLRRVLSEPLEVAS
jgi:phage-related minor tail protein